MRLRVYLSPRECIMRFKLGLMAMLALSIAFAGCKNKEQVEAENAAKKGEQEKFQGKWKVVSREGDTEEEGEMVEPSSYYVVEGDIFKHVFKTGDGKEEELSRQKLMFVADKDPKQVDLTYVDENNKPMTEKTTKKKILSKKRKTTSTEMKDVAIYKVEGDKLTLAISYDDKRPTTFLGSKGTSSYVLTLEKIKDSNAKVDETPTTTKTMATKVSGPTTGTTKISRPETETTKRAPSPTTSRTFETKG